MPPDSPAKISEWYDKLSGAYEELHGNEQSAKHQVICDILRGQKFGLVLDAGCGTGTLLGRIKDSYSHAVGVDFSLGMLGEARKNTKSEHIDFIRADCSSLPIREEIADCMLSVSTLNSAALFDDLLSELQRTTKRGGTLILTVFHQETEAPRIPTVLGIIERHARLSRRESLYVIRRHPSLRGGQTR